MTFNLACATSDFSSPPPSSTTSLLWPPRNDGDPVNSSSMSLSQKSKTALGAASSADALAVVSAGSSSWQTSIGNGQRSSTDLWSSPPCVSTSYKPLATSSSSHRKGSAKP